jgi:uncharacterized protein YbaR (Trm112 family)
MFFKIEWAMACPVDKKQQLSTYTSKRSRLEVEVFVCWSDFEISILGIP